MTETRPDRKQVRRDRLRLRDELPLAAREEFSARIVAQTIEILAAAQVRIVHCYVSFRSEVDTSALIDWLLANGIRVIAPIVRPDPAEPGRQEMRCVEITRVADLVPGHFGIPEPSGEPFTDEASIDVIIQPLASFDRRGARLGYGKGLYDKFLSRLPEKTWKLGLAFSVQEVELVPELPHDERMDVVITEREVIRCSEEVS